MNTPTYQYQYSKRIIKNGNVFAWASTDDDAKVIVTELQVANARATEALEIAREFKYCIETNFDAFSNPCNATLQRLEALEKGGGR